MTSMRPEGLANDDRRAGLGEGVVSPLIAGVQDDIDDVSARINAAVVLAVHPAGVAAIGIAGNLRAGDCVRSGGQTSEREIAILVSRGGELDRLAVLIGPRQRDCDARQATAVADD